MTSNPFTQPLRLTMNDPRFEWTRNRTMRRRLVLAFGALLLAMPALTGLFNSVLVVAILLLPFVFLMGSLNASVRGLSELRTHDLDEREVAFRGHVYARLYWPGVFLGVIAGLGAAKFGGVGVDLVIGAAAVSAFNLAMGLPTLWLAWTHPDEP